MWQRALMGQHSANVIRRRLIDTLYTEAMVLADEARSYFDQVGRQQRDMLDPSNRVAFSCESLKVTTRLMHIIAWLLTQRAVATGELSIAEAVTPSRRLGEAPRSNHDHIAVMPMEARNLIESSVTLYERVAWLDGVVDRPVPAAGPARTMQDYLAASF